MSYKFAFVGGDKRNIYLAEELTRLGHSVTMYGFDKQSELILSNSNVSNSLEYVISSSDFIICAIPFTRDNIYLNTPLSHEKILINDFLKIVPNDKLVFTGALNNNLSKIENLIDIYRTDNITNQSVIATVEGALKIAIESTDISINNSNILIIGYGKIGSYLAKSLKYLGANITIISRSSKTVNNAIKDGFSAFSNTELNENLSNKNIIFNTAEKVQIDKTNLSSIDENCIYIELASAPFGINYEDSVESNLKVIYGMSLPGIVSPKTIGNFIGLEILNYIKELKK